MLILTKRTKQSKNKIITGKPLAKNLIEWINHKNKWLTKSQSDFVKTLGEITGNFNHLDVDLDGNDFNIYLSVTPFMREQIDNAFRSTNSITIENPEGNYFNLIKITLEVN